MPDINHDGRVDWHDAYTKALSPVELVSVQLGKLLFTPLSALLHTVWFVLWFALGLSINVLTMIVSLEAIYITLFIGLGQTLADKRAQAQAAHDRAADADATKHRDALAEGQSKLLAENTQLTEVIADLTKEVHEHICRERGA